MKIRLNGIINDSIVDGPGLRLAVFTQGCPHGCPGCHNPATHDPSGGYEVDTGEIISQIEKNPLLKGVTLSGGEPFAQAGACAAIAAGARLLHRDVWTYTGYRLEDLIALDDPEINSLLAETDVLVDGPFLLAERSLELKYCGSRNQRLIDLRQSSLPDHLVLWQDPWDNLGL